MIAYYFEIRHLSKLPSSKIFCTQFTCVTACLIRNSSQYSSSWVSIPEVTNHTNLDSIFYAWLPSCCKLQREIDGKRTNFHALVVIYFPCSHLQCQYYQKNKLGIREHFYVTLNYDQYCNYTGSSYFRSIQEFNCNNDTLVTKKCSKWFNLCGDEVGWITGTDNRCKF